MKTYELTVVLPGDTTPAKIKSIKETLDKIISTFEGKIEKIDDWGKIELAYPIENQKTGNFFYYTLQMAEAGAKSVVDKIRLTDGVIRYLLVKKI